ncbi:ovarian cancer G-protein coupled receptor 1-like [Pempheris klunzingeri]|uniref:ovarian cancer G-protein coupled receptor 1-like n=1 Tax=Pempheris klunzingeri TaxID=3127111 RepID=UPI0039816669
MLVMTCTIPAIGLPLTLMAIYALYSMVRNDHTAPIYVINLLLSDLIQLSCMICEVVLVDDAIAFFMYHYSLIASVGFMVCIAMERYLVIAWPLWYRFRRTIKSSMVVCVLIWSLPIIYIVPLYYYINKDVIHAILLLLPFPLLLFFLGGTLKALSASTSVPNDEKLRIVGVLLLVLLIYTLLFMPSIILDLNYFTFNYVYYGASTMLLKLSPLADLALYIFIRKGTIELLVSPCCCRIYCSDISRPTV